MPLGRLLGGDMGSGLLLQAADLLLDLLAPIARELETAFGVSHAPASIDDRPLDLCLLAREPLDLIA